MTNSFKARFDAMAVPKFKRKGMADDMYYTPATGGAEIPCTAHIARGVQLQNAGTGAVINDQVTITAFLADIGAAPERGARFRIGAEVFTVDSISSKEESRVICLVKTGV